MAHGFNRWVDRNTLQGYFDNHTRAIIDVRDYAQWTMMVRGGSLSVHDIGVYKGGKEPYAPTHVLAGVLWRQGADGRVRRDYFVSAHAGPSVGMEIDDAIAPDERTRLMAAYNRALNLLPKRCNRVNARELEGRIAQAINELVKKTK